MPKVSIPLKNLPCPHYEEHLVWTTNDGDRIAICQMTDNHLRNCMRLISKTIEAGYTMLSMLQGEMAIYSVESDINYAQDMMDTLLHEKRRRETAAAN